MLLEAHAVSKSFGDFFAVRDANLSVDEGEIVGLIGPNGAGKSTFFNCLAGDAEPTSGKIIFDAQDMTHATPEAHARLGIGLYVSGAGDLRGDERDRQCNGGCLSAASSSRRRA